MHDHGDKARSRIVSSRDFILRGVLLLYTKLQTVLAF